MDYRDHKPQLNRQVLEMLVSGVGIRQSARIVPLSLRCLELKSRKIARHLRRLNLNLRGRIPEPLELQLDEFETFEGKRRECPVTLAVVVETRTRFLIWGESATIPAKGRMNDARRKAIEEESKKRGPRRDLSRTAVRRTLDRVVPLVRHLSRIRIETDEKLSYPVLLANAFGYSRIEHGRTPGSAPRTKRNPLFPINHTEAMIRDLLGRLRRRSWLASKKRRYLDLWLQALMAWKNYVRPRFNGEHEPPAVFAGFLSRALELEELLGWRQEYGPGRLPATATFEV